MGLLDMLKKASAHDERTPHHDGALAAPVNGAVQSLLGVALDGRGPLSPVRKAAERLKQGSGSTQAAVAKTTRSSLLGAAAGGFITSLGGFASMPVALPLNLAEFYVQATRGVGTIAQLRGYDVGAPEVRSAVTLAISGAQADDVLAKLGMTTSSNFLVGALEDQMPESAMMMVNKALSFRLLRTMGEKSLSRLGKGIPFIGGAVGAGLDAYLMFRILEQAKQEFPER